MVAAGSVDGCDKRLWSPGKAALSYWLLAFSLKPNVASRRSGRGRPLLHEILLLPLRLAAGQLLDFGFLRSAGVVAGLERLFRFAFFAGGAFGFLAFFFGQLSCICHNWNTSPLL